MQLSVCDEAMRWPQAAGATPRLPAAPTSASLLSIPKYAYPHLVLGLHRLLHVGLEPPHQRRLGGRARTACSSMQCAHTSDRSGSRGPVFTAMHTSPLCASPMPPGRAARIGQSNPPAPACADRLRDSRRLLAQRPMAADGDGRATRRDEVPSTCTGAQFHAKFAACAVSTSSC